MSSPSELLSTLILHFDTGTKEIAISLAAIVNKDDYRKNNIKGRRSREVWTWKLVRA